MTVSLPKPRGLHWFALALLVISVCINYADRGNLGVAARSLELELHLGKDQLGYLLGAFSITYAFSQLIAGKLLDHWNVNWLYALAFFLWSSATAATGLTNTFWQIMILRLLLGVGESIAYPAYSKVIVTSFPETLRGTANALIDAGSKIGPFAGVLLGVKMIEWFNWRGMFFVIGAASLLWLIPWCAVAPKLPGKIVSKTPLSTWTASYAQLLSNRTLWGTAIGLFGGNYAWYFLLNWLPYYFETERHYTKDRLAVVGSLPFLAVAISAMCFGLIADWFIRRGHHAGRVRQLCACIGLSGCGVLMLWAALVREASTCNVLIVLACISMGIWSSNHWAFTQFLAGPETAGKWTGLQNCIGNFAGILGPVVSGYAVKATHSFVSSFAIASGLLVFAVLAYWFVVGKPALVFTNPHAVSSLPATV